MTKALDGVNRERTMIRYVIVLVACIAPFVAGSWLHRTVVYDGFETEELSAHWQKTKFLPGAVQIQSSVVRAGKGAARITLRPGDQIAQEKGSELERAELREATPLWSVEDSIHAYSFSVFLPKAFPIEPTRLVIAQWKQFCPVATCTPGSPTLAVRYEAGELTIALHSTEKKEVLYRIREDIRNKWLDLRFQIRFSRSRSGRIKVWRGDAMIIDYKGVTAYPASGGYVAPAAFYFKMGLYRDRSPETMTIYFDEYRKQRLEAFAP